MLFVVLCADVMDTDSFGVRKFEVGKDSLMTGWFAVSAASRFGLSEFGICGRVTKAMSKFRRISMLEAAEIANNSEQGRMLLMERDFLRDLVAAKDEYIACYKIGKRPSEKLFARLERLTALVNGQGVDK